MMREYIAGLELRKETHLYWNGSFICYVADNITQEELDIYKEALAEFERSDIQATGLKGRKLLFSVVRELLLLLAP